MPILISTLLLSETMLVRNTITFKFRFLTSASDKQSKDTTSYIDVKSELLRDILREVLRDVKSVSVMEDKPSVTIRLDNARVRNNSNSEGRLNRMFFFTSSLSLRSTSTSYETMRMITILHD
jgi:hypothetical protein